MSGDSSPVAGLFAPPFPTVSFIDDIASANPALVESSGVVYLVLKDSAYVWRLAVDTSQWLLIRKDHAYCRHDSCRPMQPLFHYRYEKINGVFAVKSLTGYHPDSSEDSRRLHLPYAGGYVFSAIIVNQPLFDSVFVSIYVLPGTGGAPWPRSVTNRLRITTPGEAASKEVFDLRGRRISGYWDRERSMPGKIATIVNR